MTTNPQFHDYTIRLFPTPAQDEQLRRLSRAAGHARAVAYELAALRRLGEHTFAGLPNLDHSSENRSLAADVEALRMLAPLKDLPAGILTYAVIEGQRAHARQQSRAAQDSAPLAADDLLSPATDGVTVTGVQGVVRADIAQLPRWAAAVWRRAAGDVGADPQLDVTGAVCTGFGYIEYEHGEWLVDVMIRWDAHPQGSLRRRWEERLSRERRAVAHLMGW